MAAKVAFGIAAMICFWCTDVMALQPRPIDLQTELASAEMLREVVATRAECVPMKAACDHFRYEVSLLKMFRGKKEAKATIETSEQLKLGQKYLQLVTSVKVSPTERTKVEIFMPVFMQSSFANNGKGNQEWILLPRTVDAKSLGSVRLPASICFESIPGGGDLLLCDVASVLLYSKLK